MCGQAVDWKKVMAAETLCARVSLFGNIFDCDFFDLENITFMYIILNSLLNMHNLLLCKYEVNCYTNFEVHFLAFSPPPPIFNTTGGDGS